MRYNVNMHNASHSIQQSTTLLYPPMYMPYFHTTPRSVHSGTQVGASPMAVYLLSDKYSAAEPNAVEGFLLLPPVASIIIASKSLMQLIADPSSGIRRLLVMKRVRDPASRESCKMADVRAWPCVGVHGHVCAVEQDSTL